MYPIKKLLLEKMDECNLNRGQLMQKAGYRNIGSGMNSFNKFIEDLVWNDFLAKGLADPLGTSYDEIKKTFKESQRQREADIDNARRTNFKPQLYVVSSLSRPTSITFAGLIGGIKDITLPRSILTETPESELKMLRRIMYQYRLQFDNKVLMWGDLLGFVYWKYYDQPEEERVAFDNNGNISETISKHIPRARPQVFIKNHEITGLI